MIFLISNRRHGTIWQKWKSESTMFGGSTLFIFIEEGHDASDGWSIKAYNWHCKGNIKECKAKINMIPVDLRDIFNL